MVASRLAKQHVTTRRQDQATMKQRGQMLGVLPSLIPGPSAELQVNERECSASDRATLATRRAEGCGPPRSSQGVSARDQRKTVPPYVLVSFPRPALLNVQPTL